MLKMAQGAKAKKDEIRFVKLLLGRGATTKYCESEIIVRCAEKSARLSSACVAVLASQGVLTLQAGLPRASELTRGWLQRMLCDESMDGEPRKGEPSGQTQPFADQHRHIRPETPSSAADASPLNRLFNDHESPLAKLALLKKRDKSPYISPHHIVAGERLRADFDKAHLGASVVMNWNAAYTSSGGSGNGGGDISDMAIDARARLSKCYAVMGNELAGVLIDFCGYLKGLETIELERGWPRRSAKLAIRLALDQLARHYGLDEGVARARDKAGERSRAAGPMKSWGDKPTGFGAVV